MLAEFPERGAGDAGDTGLLEQKCGQVGRGQTRARNIDPRVKGSVGR